MESAFALAAKTVNHSTVTVLLVVGLGAFDVISGDAMLHGLGTVEAAGPRCFSSCSVDHPHV